MIETPKRMRLNWWGPAGEAPRAGAFFRTERGRVLYVVSVRPVNVRVTKGETSRHAVEYVDWRDEIPEGARVYDIRWEAR